MPEVIFTGPAGKHEIIEELPVELPLVLGNEEMLIVLSGDTVLRTPGGEALGLVTFTTAILISSESAGGGGAQASDTGISLINIGVGPSNAKTITDHIAVLRPHAWLMIGHCAGLRNTQRLGDYVLAHGYVREDHVLDHELPLWVPIPALAEMQVALEVWHRRIPDYEIAPGSDLTYSGNPRAPHTLPLVLAGAASLTAMLVIVGSLLTRKSDAPPPTAGGSTSCSTCRRFAGPSPGARGSSSPLRGRPPLAG